MGPILYAIAAVLFFLTSVGVVFLPNQGMWGLFFVALGMAVGTWRPWAVRTG